MLSTIELETAKLPEIKTPLPGPKAQAVVARDAQYISPSYTRTYPLVMQRGRGAMIEDVDLADDPAQVTPSAADEPLARGA